MSTKDVVFCDHCGKQLTQFDFEGDAIHHGLKVEGALAIKETQRTSSGSSYRPVFEMHGTDFCSYACLAKRFQPLSTVLEKLS